MDEQNEARGEERNGYDRRDTESTATAFALGSASRAKADAYLDEQMTVARAQTDVLHLQAHELKHELRLRHWSLRVRHISDVMKLAFEIAVAFIVLAVATAIGFEFWDAAHDNGLVIEAFQVPPDMAAKGLTGQVVASQLLDKLSSLQQETQSARPAQSYANNWGDDIKVQIPDTGVSVGEFTRYLHAWLGHQSIIDGEVFRTANGITVTARVQGDGAASFSGPESSLDDLIQKAAERVYRQTQPYRYAIFRVHSLTSGDAAEVAEAKSVFESLTTSPDREERAWAWLGLANTARFFQNDMRTSSDEFRKALADKPGFVVALFDLAQNEDNFGHNENALAVGRQTEEAFRHAVLASALIAQVYARENDVQDDTLVGDYPAVIADSRQGLRLADVTGSHENFRENILLALAAEHDSGGESAALKAFPRFPDADLSDRASKMVAVLTADAWLEDWSGAAALGQVVEKAQWQGFPGQDNVVFLRANVRPWVALAKAKLGDIADASRVVDTTPLDCYDCVRVRGMIAEIAHRPNDAARWYADAVRQAPSIPMAYRDWGALLLHRGRYEVAIQNFATAHSKGPHWADPLEMWGEALMQQNRSDLALPKFAEANKYAPNWGRLHLKWGEALFYAGHAADSNKQIAIASALDLSQADKAALDKWMTAHG